MRKAGTVKKVEFPVKWIMHDSPLPAGELEIRKDEPVKDEPTKAPNGAGVRKERARSAAATVTTFR